MNTEENEILWGNRVVQMMIFFDNVRCIPENRQREETDAFAVDRRSTHNSTTGMSQ